MQLQKIPALCQKTVAELCKMLKEKKTTSIEITQAYLTAIERNNEAINAYLEVFSEEALAEATASDERREKGEMLSILDGIPVALKDNIVIKGHVASCASKMLANFISPYDATVTKKLKAAGMPILGVLNMDEFAMGGSTENSAFGVTRNPFDLTRVPGGSSGGSAASVSAGLAPIALGSDTGGSIRQPASFCGVVGVKPSYGAVSRYGLVAFASSLDQIGPLAKTAEDATLLLSIICGHDLHDATSDAKLAPMEATLPQMDLSGYVIGMPKECFLDGLQAEVKNAIMDVAKTFVSLGATVKEVSIPSLPSALSAYYVLSSAEASSNLARFDGVRYGHRASEYDSLDDLYRKSRQEAFGDEVKRRIMLGTFALSSGYQDQYYSKAQQVQKLLRYEVEQALENCDVLLSPVSPMPAFKLGEKTSDPMDMYLCDIYTVPANITGLPAISIPCGETNGLPIGFSFMGKRDSLPTMLSAASIYEKTTKPLQGKHPYEFTEGSEKA